jgi:hypothetical protein
MKIMHTSSARALAIPLNPELSPMPEAAALARFVGAETSRQILRMFRDPRTLEKEERTALVCELRRAIELAPGVPEVRVLFGMALCVDLQAQEALEQLKMAAGQAPDCFIARLKYGELLMRLRICGKAAEETHQAARLAANAAQSELARRQATTIRAMMHDGIERGGFTRLVPRMFRRRRVDSGSSAPAIAGTK